MRTSSKMSVKEIKESTGTWKILDDVLKKIKKLKPGKVPSLPEMEHLLKELRKGKRKGGSVVSKKRKKSIPYPRKFPDDPGAAHPDYEQKNPYLKGKQKKAKGGTVSRKSGGKIMQGYKAGGKV